MSIYGVESFVCGRKRGLYRIFGNGFCVWAVDVGLCRHRNLGTGV